MKANKIQVEYVKELLDNIHLTNPCGVCEETLKDLKKVIKKDYKKRFGG